MHENPVRSMCTHPWLEHILWKRYPHDLSWWVSGTQKHRVWDSPCNSCSAFMAADAALDKKPAIRWSSLLFLCFYFFLFHVILHQNTSVVHLNLFNSQVCELWGWICTQPYCSLFSSFLYLILFSFFPRQTENCFFRVKSCLPFVLLLSNLQTEEWAWWISDKMCLLEALRKKELPW